MDIGNVALYGLVFILQFLDWLTTKIFTKHNPLAEGNPFFHEKFAQNGGPSLTFLSQKLIVGVLTVYFLVRFQNQSVMYDLIFGMGVWLMLYVIIHNTCGIIKDYAEKKLGIWKPYTKDDLLKIAVGSISRDICLALFLFALGVVIYKMTHRTFILWMAVGIVVLMAMSVCLAVKFYHSRSKRQGGI